MVSDIVGQAVLDGGPEHHVNIELQDGSILQVNRDALEPAGDGDPGLKVREDAHVHLINPPKKADPPKVVGIFIPTSVLERARKQRSA